MMINKIKAAIIKELVENYCWDLDEIISITKRKNLYIIKSKGHFNYGEFYYDINAGHFYLETSTGTKKYSMLPKWPIF